MFSYLHPCLVLLYNNILGFTKFLLVYGLLIPFNTFYAQFRVFVVATCNFPEDFSLTLGFALHGLDKLLL